MKKWLMSLFLLFILISIIIYVYLKDFKNVDQDNYLKLQGEHQELPTEIFINEHLFHKDGTIRTDFQQNEGGHLVLSESIGLWMEYLLEKGDTEQFELAFQTVNEHLLLKDNLIAWRIKDGNVAQTNALIDDIRIVEALFTMGERTGNTEYIDAARTISKAVVTYNRQDNYFVDFYDINHRYANEELTLSYLNFKSFQYMEKYRLIPSQLIVEIKDFMKNIPLESGFYPKYFHIKEQKFHYDKTINLVDQLYTAIYIEQSGAKTDEFYTWLKDEFYKEGILYGRYKQKTDERAVEYEAASVYALTIMYALERDDNQFAKDLYDRMITMQVRDETSPYYGGYADEFANRTHSFDNLLPLLAERILLNERVLE